ncbi:uncharacterized protein G2W53_032703 [Senna tora]|uniref:Uncharacterized protein n=1 Tax=Senna tora TaxID=362788 RepID=A0A834T0X7_9FABA|nr:uncharacterized protein G2W53_032703 [Senna tora]
MSHTGHDKGKLSYARHNESLEARKGHMSYVRRKKSHRA